MERRAFLLGMSGLMLSACTSGTQQVAAPNPYAGGPRPGARGPTAAARTGRRFSPQQPGTQGCLPPPSATRRAAVGGVHYRVVPGDTLASIQRRSGASVAAIRQANGIQGSHIEVGRLLWLPGGRPIDVLCVPGPSGKVVCEPLPTAPARRGGYRIVSRGEWHARRLRSNHDPMRGVRRITLHHTDEVPGLTSRGDREIVAAIQRYHQDTMGWADIGYHYLIGRDGLIYEGRAATAQGAHSGGANNIQNLGIAMVGNFTHRMPNHAQMNALEAFLADQRAQQRVAASAVLGHRDLAPTECPGGTFYRWLDRYKLG